MKHAIRKLAFVFGAASILLSGIAFAADGPGLTHDKVAAWLEGYQEAWETLDADKAAALFTEGATYRDNPYAEPYQGRQGIHEYWTTVTSDQRDVEFSYEVLSVSGNIGIAHWHSEFTQESSGSGVVLDGIFVLEFTPEGLCRSLKEWWHLQVNPAEEK
jgi:nuclear transport factor 2 (NTF2) superfamily protein